jgi:iron complex transport system ATP-binding protein
MNSKKRF